MSESELYLILHKVRGEPAFDIAHQIEMEGEECWIVGTSGHRAYPYGTWRLCDLTYAHGWGWHNNSLFEGMSLKPPTSDWPDHYPVNKSPPEEKFEARSLLASLGLPTTMHNAMTGKLVRRV